MKTFHVYLGIGSNLGERHEFLNRAVKALGGLRDSKVIWTSSVYETEPVGVLKQPKFLNAAVEIETSLPPPDLLEEVKRIETAAGRRSTEHWGPREIDIDILIYDGLVFEDERVKVPHPELEKRRFVLIPLREIAPDLVHPISGMTVEELASACNDGSRISKSVYHIKL
jgi:2-amino-4-hydroxy-6-hydroxymethyldihydropteridine diphosphokinase